VNLVYVKPICVSTCELNVNSIFEKHVSLWGKMTGINLTSQSQLSFFLLYYSICDVLQFWDEKNLQTYTVFFLNHIN